MTRDALIKAMNVAGDYRAEEHGGRQAKQRTQRELDLIKQLEEVPADALAKCWPSGLFVLGENRAVIYVES